MPTENSTPETNQPFWQSKTVIRSFVAVICTVLSVCGLDVSADTQNIIVDNVASIGGGIASLYLIVTAFKGK